MKKISTVAAFRTSDFLRAKTDDRFGSGRSLVVLLCFGCSRHNYS